MFVRSLLCSGCVRTSLESFERMPATQEKGVRCLPARQASVSNFYRQIFTLPKSVNMKIATAILVLCVLNFMAFAIGCIVYGGSSGNGYIEEGRYYFSDHGKITEVSLEIWNYS